MTDRIVNSFGVVRKAILISVLAVTAAMGISQPIQAQAQIVPAILGAAAGLTGGYVVTNSLFVAEARAGNFIYSTEDLKAARWEYIPMPLGAGGGMLMGISDSALLGKVALGAGIGLAGGATVGWFVGKALWEGPEGQWAGAILGGALGMLVGGTISGIRHSSNGPSSQGGNMSNLRFNVKIR